MKYFLIIVFVGAISFSCSTSYITSSWKSEKATPKSYNKIMVLGLIGDPDKTIREKMEEHLAGDLIDLGYNATTSAGEDGPNAFENMKEEEAVKQLRDRRIDAVLTVVLLDETKESYYVPARRRNYNFSDHGYYAGYPSRFWGYYRNINSRVHSRGYYGVNTRYFWESNFYDLNSGELLYSAKSQSFDPESPQLLGHEYGLMIVKDMIRKKILEKVASSPYKAF